MNKIKVIIGLIFLLSIILAILSNSMAKESRDNILVIERLTNQKTFTQDIVKSILYLYKKQNGSLDVLETNIQDFLDKDENRFINIDKKTSKLWNKFYLKVFEFLKQQKVSSPYSSIFAEKLLNNIYTINIDLIVSFDNLIKKKQQYFHASIEYYKKIQRILFIILIFLLLYLFTQLGEIIEFVQKILKISNGIIKKSTIKEVKLLSVDSKEKNIKEIVKNYNYFLKQINNSINYSNKSIDITVNSLEELENNIENFMELLFEIEKKQNNDEVFKKEDILIELLEIFSVLKNKLKALQKELEELKIGK
jgi:hypothetical protein